MSDITKTAYTGFKMLNNINQSFKTFADLYCILNNNLVLIASNLSFIEKVGIIYPDGITKILPFENIIINPFDFFVYQRDTKKKDMLIKNYDDKFILGTKDNLDSFIAINKISDKSVVDNFIDKYYKHLQLIVDNMSGDYERINDDVIEKLLDKECVDITLANSYNISITKSILMELKSDYSLSALVIPENNDKFYVIFKVDNSIMSIYTLTSFLLY